MTHRLKNYVRLMLARLLSCVLRMYSHPHTHSVNNTLIFSPHADDETLGCGGLIASRTEKQLPVHVAFITDSGGTSHDPVHRQSLSLQRRQEALSALNVLGVAENSVSFFDAPDGNLPQLEETEKQRLLENMSQLLKQLQPEAIYLPFKGSHSSEHEAAHELVLLSISKADWHGLLFEYPVWAWWNPIRFARHLPEKERPVYLPLSYLLPTKQQALLQHQSQHQAGSGLPSILGKLCLGPWEFFFPVKQPPQS